MATSIKNIPTLRDDAAKTFIERADRRAREGKSVTFAKQVSVAKDILRKANMR